MELPFSTRRTLQPGGALSEVGEGVNANISGESKSGRMVSSIVSGVLAADKASSVWVSRDMVTLEEIGSLVAVEPGGETAGFGCDIVPWVSLL